MHFLLIEPYYGGSHQSWVDGYTASSQHTIDKLTMPAQFWKWRMQGGAVTMARLYNLYVQQQQEPHLIIASDMMDVSLFHSLTKPKAPVAIYFHENQLTYPQNRRQKHGWQYGFINYASALTADALFFNSQYHMDDFFAELPRMLKHFADYNELHTIADLRQKASVLPLGLSLKRFDEHHCTCKHDVPIILWNHRWEADKNPSAFFEALYQLDEQAIPFNLVLLGENFRQQPQEFLKAKEHFGSRILHYGFTENFAEYAQWLWKSDYVISTSYQDFFGISVAEAIYCGCIPLLANRLNYPYLIPEAYHDLCLFREGALEGLLKQYLLGNIQIDVQPLQTNIAQYDWATMSRTYDKAFEELL